MSPILRVLTDYVGWLLILAGIGCVVVASWRGFWRMVDETLFPKEKR